MCPKKIRLLVSLLFILSTILPVSTNIINTRSTKTNLDCTVQVNEIKYDLSRFYSTSGYEIRVGDTKYVLNICGSVDQCETDNEKYVAVCQIDVNTNNVTVIGLANHMTLLQNFKPMPGINYKYSNGGLKLTATIEFRCNPKINNSKIIYNAPTGEVGKKRKFIFETRYMCVKTVSYCQIYNNIIGFNYNLHPLYKQSDYIIKLNTSSIILNICGNLSKKLGGDCSHDSTQICLLNKNGEYKSLGAYPKPYQNIDQEGRFSVTFEDGSLCMNQKYIETQIDFQCSWVESNISLVTASFCQYRILWKTKHACPKYRFIHKNCIVKSDYYYTDYREFLLPSKTVNIVLENDSLLVLNYSICNHGPTNCKGSINVSICLHRDNKEIIYGYYNKTILSVEGLLKMKLYGEHCTDNIQYTTIINLLCAYSKTNQQMVKIMKISSCHIEMNLYTSLACPFVEPKTSTCLIEYHNITYNLKPLSLLDENYLVKGPDDITFTINMCRPLVYGNTSMCSQESMICLYNKSEPIVNNRYITLGNYLHGTKYYLNNSHLTAKFDGGMCKNVQNYLTEMQFICSNTTQDPTLLHHDDCHFIFEWKTEHACPLLLNEIKSTTEGRIVKNTTVFNEDIEVTEKPKIFITPLTTPIKYDNVTNENDISHIILSDIYIDKCLVVDRVHDKKINFTSISKSIILTSHQGKLYSLNICDNNNNVCNTPVCGGNGFHVPYASRTNIDLKVDHDHQFIQLTFLSFQHCFNSFYNSSIIMRCNYNYELPTILREDRCSVHFEWNNNATCAFLDIKPNPNEDHSIKYVYIIVVASVLVLIFIGTLLYKFRCYRIMPNSRYMINKREVRIYYRNSED